MLALKLIYLAVVAVLCLFYILYIDSFALIMLICMLALPLLLKGTLLWLKFASAAAMTCDLDTCSAGESIPVTITIRNRAPLSFSHVHAVIDLQHSFGTKNERMHLQFPLQPNNITKMTFYVHADFCGSLDMTLKKLYVLDYFHLLRTNLIVRERSTNVLILPQLLPLPLYNLSEPVLSPESDTFGDRPGDDPSEIFGIHEYAPGEPVSRIHWKLSSKEDKLLVKEFSMPIQKTALLVLSYDSRSSANPQHRIQEAETLLTLFYSISCQMLAEMLVPTILWYDENAQQIKHHRLTAGSELIDLFRILYSTLHSMNLDPQKLSDAVTGLQFSSATCICNHLPHVLVEVIDQRVTANQKNILVVKAEHDPAINAEHAEVIPIRPGSVQEDIHQLIV